MFPQSGASASGQQATSWQGVGITDALPAKSASDKSSKAEDQQRTLPSSEEPESEQIPERRGNPVGRTLDVLFEEAATTSAKATVQPAPELLETKAHKQKFDPQPAGMPNRLRYLPCPAQPCSVRSI